MNRRDWRERKRERNSQNQSCRKFNKIIRHDKSHQEEEGLSRISETKYRIILPQSEDIQKNLDAPGADQTISTELHTDLTTF